MTATLQSVAAPDEVLAASPDKSIASTSFASTATMNDGISQEKMDQVLKEVDVDHPTAARYLRATGGDVHHSIKRLKDTKSWRDAERPDLMCCSACQSNHHSHYMQLVAFDKQERPVIYSCLELADNRNVEDNRIHMLACFESAIAAMPPGVEQWIWCLDFHGFGVRDMNPTLAKIFLHVSAAHYPERLGQIVVIDAPRLFSTLWKAITPFVDPKTKEKIKWVGPQPKNLRPLFDELLDNEETAAWFVEEVQENRRKNISKIKAYNFPELAQLAVEGEESEAVKEAAKRRRAVSSSGEHDHLGSPAYLKRIAGHPELLLPQTREMASSSPL